MSAISTLINHLQELRTLLERMEPNHIARPTIEARIEECKTAIDKERA